ncbi:DUF3427 domain-containing protein [Sulfuriroseicoccus oceanibius]|uniref:DUF3427 domain-containing protein n=1 Tax=Sulfuriroseicoccus oceanibius TaxID=2707525 RepID=A0A6B3LEF2_9BACT|nr:DEAD/DEAH box helicase [Sulfuriroseicoccus oceanibius]QQL45376.1 DUF3427 domain-containing protein [Sulfuriroseicoccus oceanibius]
MSDLQLGIYERPLDIELEELLRNQPELKATLRKIDDEAAPHLYAQFVGQLVQQALRIESADRRITLVNRLVELLSETEGLDFLARKQLLDRQESLLLEVTSTPESLPRPALPVYTSSLHTGQGSDPPLEHELRAEIKTADSVDILVSFIKWSGLRLLLPAFKSLSERGIPVRIISTSYMGASDPNALEWLAKQPNVSVKVSFDTTATRLHAKAYHFVRKTGYSSAFIGSANMSHSAMTSGLEWTMKVTQQDMAHVLERFSAEFATYWESPEFERYTENDFSRFRQAIHRHRTHDNGIPTFFAEIHPKPFQQRILEALNAARSRGLKRNLIVAATGTGKTVISALDYQSRVQASKAQPKLLFVAHRKEILEQALGCFRTVLRDQNFGELLVDSYQPTEWQHVFASVQSLNSNKPWARLGPDHFDHIIVDEVHHGPASSYRAIFDDLKSTILLGLTATPERMDGASVLDDFGGEFAAEIRLPEALEEKLLCPFHYFGVTDNVDLSGDHLWRNGRYDQTALDNVLTGDHLEARERLDMILAALERYHPEYRAARAVGFCASKNHAHYMADSFKKAGISAATILGDTPRDERKNLMRQFRDGKVTFLFTVDVLSEGVDVPEIDLVLFLRPTESLTVFLQQLGRGLRHAPEKECLTVLDFVGHTHRNYRLETKFTALLSRRRQRLDKEIEDDFPHLAPGCSIQLERVARERILHKIKSVLSNLNHFVPEVIKTWEQTSTKPLTFGNFLAETDLSPIDVLKRKTWSEWKASAGLIPKPEDPYITQGRKALSRIALRSDPTLLTLIESQESRSRQSDEKLETALHYLFWGRSGKELGMQSLDESRTRWLKNQSLVADAKEIAAWRRSTTPHVMRECPLPYQHSLKLHAAYGSAEIKAAFELSSLEKSGPAGQGVIHVKKQKTYIHLVTFRKEENDFSPSTRYQDYPISPTKLHWESQSTVTQSSPTGQNYIHFKERGYTILFFARLEKKTDGETSPFVFLGPARSLISFKNDRPISMTWELEYPIPASLFEEARAI